MKWLILILGVSSNAFASVLIKIAITPPFKFPNIKAPLEALQNWPFWLGLFCYGAAFLFYAAALERLPLNVAHPILTSGTVASVAIVSVLLFNEPFNWVMALGVTFVISGVMLISTQAT